jgi:hypothetical protein
MVFSKYKIIVKNQIGNEGPGSKDGHGFWGLI